ncbi:MAG: VWA domain-containing protein [Verrucomicrobia bacterium]|nr:VWA domain-containing protein [Verrucomicrobiota bacterium]
MIATTLLTALPLVGSAAQVKLDVSLANPVLIAGKKQTTYLKVGLTGFEMEGKSKRTPANIAIVIDRSGSMQGDKIKQAKEAARVAISRLNGNDIVSVVAYDDTVSVLVPATKASDREAILAGIDRIEAGGSTALFAGVSKGAEEVRKFLTRDRVNRVILLSDGLANVGPDTPGALGELGSSLVKEGISVTTLGLGLGFNEDLMSLLAQRSDGNHAFIEHSKDLVKIFNYEFGDVLSVVAQEVLVTINCAEAVRPVKVLGRQADIAGQNVVASINQLYSNQEKYLMLEVEIPEGSVKKPLDVANVKVTYANMSTKTTDTLTSAVAVRFTESEEQVVQKRDKVVLEAAVMQVATERNIMATQLRDEGKVEEAQKLLIFNAGYLQQQAGELESEQLDSYAGDNRDDSMNLDASSWKARRKSMRDVQYKNTTQRSY